MEYLTPWIIAVVLPLYWCLHVLYNLFLHPLSRYPGPKLWAASRLPYAISLARGNLVHDTWAIHEKYGKIVRLAPNELSFTNKEAWQDIYGFKTRGHAEFPKNPAWIRPAPNGAWSILDAPEDIHTRQRKILNYAFSHTALKSQEPYVQKYASLLVQRARELGEMDMKDWYAFTTFDITGDLTFGQSFYCLENGKYHRWVAYLFAHLKASCLLASISFYPLLLNILWFFLPKSSFNERLYHFQKSVKWVHKRLDNKTDREDFISYITDNNVGKTMTIEEIEATSGTLVIAGSETSSTVLTSTTLNLLINPEKLRKLAQEIRTSFTVEDEITGQALSKLPYLNAVFHENFRYSPPVPCSIPRVVPKGGDVIAGHRFPEGTFVGLPQIPVYRSCHYFALPHSFIPERWLDPHNAAFFPTGNDPAFDKNTFVHDDRAVVQPFSVGPRQCIAQNLGLLEVKVILARLLWNFDLEFVGGEKEILRMREQPWDTQKTFGLWVKRPLHVRLIPVTKAASM